MIFNYNRVHVSNDVLNFRYPHKTSSKYTDRSTLVKSIKKFHKKVLFQCQSFMALSSSEVLVFRSWIVLKNTWSSITCHTFRFFATKFIEPKWLFNNQNFIFILIHGTIVPSFIYLFGLEKIENNRLLT